MSTKRIGFALLAGVVFATVLPAAAQQPRFLDAKVETRSAGGNLAAAFHSIAAEQAGPVWIAYALAAVPGRHQMCCYDYAGDGHAAMGSGCCRLEEKSEGVDIRTGEPVKSETPVPLEPSRSFFIFLRVVKQQVAKVRMFSPECEIDAGGRTVYWLDGVGGGESVALLSTLVRGEHWQDRKHRSHDEDEDDDDDSGESIGHTAIAAIAMHADAAADAALERFVAPSEPESLRKQAAFWLGVGRGKHGYEVLHRMVNDDPSDRVREQAIFALSQSRVPEALDAMIETARNDRSTHVRGQALFWLGQRAGRKAASAITESIENDPETEVKKKAVFALSQLPRDEGVPLLIQVARTNRNPAVRKQAIFWLGQSNDPRALNFFEEILR